MLTEGRKRLRCSYLLRQSVSGLLSQTNYNDKLPIYWTVSVGHSEPTNNSVGSYIKQVVNSIGLESFNVAIFLKPNT